MAKTLLEKARERKMGKSRGVTVNDETVELALAWVNNEVTLIQVAEALGFKGSSNAYPALSHALAQQIRNLKNK